MKKKLVIGFVLLICMTLWAPAAMAFPREDHVWGKWKKYQSNNRQHGVRDYSHHKHRQHNQQHTRVFVNYRNADDCWYDNHRSSNFRVDYADRNKNRMLRVSYHTYDGDSYLRTVERHHGQYTHKTRIYYQGAYRPAYYWVGNTTIIRLVFMDDGRAYTVAWKRSEAERTALELGYSDGSTIAYYRQFTDNMPADICERYIEEVLVDTDV